MDRNAMLVRRAVDRMVTGLMRTRLSLGLREGNQAGESEKNTDEFLLHHHSCFVLLGGNPSVEARLGRADWWLNQARKWLQGTAYVAGITGAIDPNATRRRYERSFQILRCSGNIRTCALHAVIQCDPPNREPSLSTRPRTARAPKPVAKPRSGERNERTQPALFRRTWDDGTGAALHSPFLKRRSAYDLRKGRATRTCQSNAPSCDGKALLRIRILILGECRMKAPLLISAVLGALMLGLFGGPLGSFADQTQPAVRMIAPAIMVELDRTRKGDRLATSGAAVTTIEKIRPAAKPDPRLAPVKLGDCEPLASPIVDAALAKLTGRCFV